MPSPELSPTPAELETLLNGAMLRISSDVKIVKLGPDRLLVKNQPGRRYLVLTLEQWDMLQAFGSGSTVPQMLSHLFTEKRSLTLRKFYELVVAAVAAGILLSETRPPPPLVVPTVWKVRLSGKILRWVAVVICVGSVGAIGIHPSQLPHQPIWLLPGWLAAGVMASLGMALAASVLSAAGAEVYQPRIGWKTPLPRWQIDLEDAAMGGRETQVNAALVQLAPSFAGAAAAAWWIPELSAPLLGGALWLLSPFWRTPLQELLAALYREPRLATDQGLLPDRNPLLASLGRAMQRRTDNKYFLAWFLASIAWLLTVFFSGCALWRVNAVEVLQQFAADGGWQFTSQILQGLAILLAAGAVGVMGWVGYNHLRAGWRERAERRLRPATVLLSPQSIADWLSRTVLFRDLPPEELTAVAGAVQIEKFKRGSYVVREGEPGDKLYIIVSGDLEVRRNYSPGRSEPVARMGEGELFGEIALLQDGVRTRSIRCLRASVLLGLARIDFERLVLSHLSRRTVEDAVQKVAFLQVTELTRQWSHATMAEFARQARLQEFATGTVILQEGLSNLWFFIVYRGELSVRQRGKELRRLKIGDSFGEISLLKEGEVTASVVVTSKTASCLIINGADFLNFITRDFTAGLRWENLLAARRGGPVLGKTHARS